MLPIFRSSVAPWLRPHRLALALAALGAVALFAPLALAGAPPQPEKAAQAVAMTPPPASRAAIEAEITRMFGLVPVMFTSIPDDELELEWRLFKKVQFDPGPIPNKYRELIGLGLSSVAKCAYCVAYHTEVAKLFGATDAEIEATVHYAKSSAGWSAYLNGMAVDLPQFKDEVRRAVSHAREQSAKAK